MTLLAPGEPAARSARDGLRAGARAGAGLAAGSLVLAVTFGASARQAGWGQIAPVDGSWVTAHGGGGKFDRHVLFGATLPQWPAWVAGAALDVVFPAFFALLLLDDLRAAGRARGARLVGATSAAITALLLWVLPLGPALLGGSAAALVGLRHGKQR